MEHKSVAYLVFHMTDNHPADLITLVSAYSAPYIVLIAFPTLFNRRKS